MFWHLAVRKVYIAYKYRVAKPIPFPADLSDEELFTLIQDKINYPDQLHIFWNEEGEIVIQGKYGEHILTIEEDSIFVERDLSRNGKNIEEGEVLDAYIRKIFDSDSPVNPYKKWKKLNSHAKKYKRIHIGVVGVVLIAIIWGISQYGGYRAARIRESHLPQFSETVSIDRAFESFFEDGRWKEHSEGGIKYVDYIGTYVHGKNTANVVIRFLYSDTEFKVHTAFVDGEELMPLEVLELFEAIYQSA